MNTNDFEKAVPAEYGIIHTGDNKKLRNIYAGNRRIYKVFVGDTEVFS